ncbi:MAG TPA: CusA/CzcA family heavy metal efflux RND transporter [Candidatus Limnocylindria bacterium]|nr:CusA/CzcA family heavy metal efflux RND transporter [Candidatus Limnocylindria bacterium]
MSTERSDSATGPLERVLLFGIRQRWLVVAATIAMAALGIFNFARLPIDAVPDITNVQVQINTVVEGLAPVDVEQRVTFPIETAMAGIPGLESTRSLSRYGLSQVTVIFKDGTDIYFARQLVNERLQEARGNLPAGLAESAMGPIATGLGEIFMWTVEARPGAQKPDGAPYTAMDLREIQDWVVKPQLRTVPGVTEINTIGGYEKQYHVTPDPVRLIAYGLTFHDVWLALDQNNSSAGGGFIAHKGEQYLVHTTGRLQSQSDIGQVVIATRSGVPIRVRDVAAVGLGGALRAGAATENGEEVVLGTAFMLIGENSRTVSKRVAERLSEVNQSLPPGVVARVVYDRTKLVEATLETVKTNLLEGAALVIAVLFLLLGNFTAALIVALVIPLSMLFAVTGMVQGHISANLLSLGAIDFGIIVDGAVVMVENILRRFGERARTLGRPLDRSERLDEAYRSAGEVARPTFFGVAIIMIVYLPILTLSGIEGKMFRPMAQVVLLALLGALILAFTFVPAVVALLLKPKGGEHENRVIATTRRFYLPRLRWALDRPWQVLTGAFVLLVICLLMATTLGSEFIPTLDEHDVAIQALRIPGTSVEQAVAMQKGVEGAIASFPEVSFVFARIGTAEVANDPMPPNIADVYVMLEPRKAWPNPRRSKVDLIAAIEKRLELLPGNAYEYTQPIEMRFNELIAGVRGDVAVKVFGDDLAVMLSSGSRIAEILRSVRGAADVRVEQVTGQPTLTIAIDRPAVARFGLNVADVQAVVRTALAGTGAGDVFEGDRRFAIVVRLPEELRRDLHALEMLPVPVKATPRVAMASALPTAHAEGRTEFVPLGVLARIALEEGPNQVSRENGKRRVVVQANVRGRDLGGFVAEAQRKVASSVHVPPGYWLTWGGQFENLIAARTRLAIVVPVALLLIFVLLFVTFGSIKDSLLVFSGVPLALTGGILALAIRGLPFSITAGVGFIALSGVAVLNGVVMLSFIDKLRRDGAALLPAILEGCTTRLRPVLMTALVASLGFVPMAVATGIGAEVQRPLATVVIGGIISSTILTLLVLPVLYLLAYRGRKM